MELYCKLYRPRFVENSGIYPATSHRIIHLLGNVIATWIYNYATTILLTTNSKFVSML
jgi:hypothetical protein